MHSTLELDCCSDALGRSVDLRLLIWSADSWIGKWHRQAQGSPETFGARRLISQFSRGSPAHFPLNDLLRFRIDMLLLCIDYLSLFHTVVLVAYSDRNELQEQHHLRACAPAARSKVVRRPYTVLTQASRQRNQTLSHLAVDGQQGPGHCPTGLAAMCWITLLAQFASSSELSVTPQNLGSKLAQAHQWSLERVGQVQTCCQNACQAQTQHNCVTKRPLHCYGLLNPGIWSHINRARSFQVHLGNFGILYSAQSKVWVKMRNTSKQQTRCCTDLWFLTAQLCTAQGLTTASCPCGCACACAYAYAHVCMRVRGVCVCVVCVCVCVWQRVDNLAGGWKTMDFPTQSHGTTHSQQRGSLHSLTLNMQSTLAKRSNNAMILPPT